MKKRPCKNAPDCKNTVRMSDSGLCRACWAEARRPQTAPRFESDGDTRTTEKAGERVVETLTKRDVRTLEDLVAVCAIDLEKWDVVEWHANKWAMGYKDKAKVAHSIDLFQVKARMRPRSPLVKTLESIRAGLLEDLRAEARRAPAILPARADGDGQWLFEFSPVDIHLGKYCWAEETVTNCDLASATDLFDQSLEFLIDRAVKLAGGRIDRVLFLIGNDVSHVDGKGGETTGGTKMEAYDGRFAKVYRRICSTHRRAIRRLLEVAPVDGVVVPGNHDEVTAFHLGELLEASFESNPHVHIDNSARLTKYYDYGVNLFGFTHGDALTVKELPLLMAREAPKLWAQCPSREWHIGHKHIAEKWEAGKRGEARLEQDLFSDKGIRVRRLSSLSAHDAWHTKHGYTDRRACDAFVFHKEAGYTANISFNVDHFTGKAVSK